MIQPSSNARVNRRYFLKSQIHPKKTCSNLMSRIINTMKLSALTRKREGRRSKLLIRKRSARIPRRKRSSFRVIILWRRLCRLRWSWTSKEFRINCRSRIEASVLLTSSIRNRSSSRPSQVSVQALSTGHPMSILLNFLLWQRLKPAKWHASKTSWLQTAKWRSKKRASASSRRKTKIRLGSWVSLVTLCSHICKTARTYRKTQSIIVARNDWVKQV